MFLVGWPSALATGPGAPARPTREPRGAQIRSPEELEGAGGGGGGGLGKDKDGKLGGLVRGARGGDPSPMAPAIVQAP